MVLHDLSDSYDTDLGKIVSKYHIVLARVIMQYKTENSVVVG